MKRVQHSFFAMSLVLVAGVLVGCGTTPPKDFGGRWKSVNRFAKTSTEIPLYSSYVFQASPTDGTLKTMLGRWAKDAGLTLDYRLTSDYTLYGPVADISTTNPQQAASEVTAAYSAKGIVISISGSALTVASVAASDGSGG